MVTDTILKPSLPDGNAEAEITAIVKVAMFLN